MISGRMYCTTAARCSPTPPAMSRRKQAMQKPMFSGLPRGHQHHRRGAHNQAGQDDQPK